KDGCKVVGYSRTQMYCLHPQGVGRGCKADESATTTHRHLILAVLFSLSNAKWNNEGWLYLLVQKDFLRGDLAGYAVSCRMTKNLTN
ncbi:MAG: hypothetical protein ABL876_18055, partial [Chitinophagaceae bacterium]